LPAPSARLNGVLRLTNVGDRPVDVFPEPDLHDGVSLTIEVTGLGAVNLPSRVVHTMEWRTAEPTELGPGATLEIPITSLKSGNRGDSRYSYWTEGGTYRMTVTYRVERSSGEGRSYSVTSTPVDVEVVSR
jgi:hypothetical protein